MEQGGGLVPMDYFSTQIPQFTLYGDGTAVYQAQSAAVAASTAPGPRPDPPFRIAKLTEQEVQELLISALNEGHLGVAKPTYDLAGVADAPTTLFTVDAGGYDKTVNVYALGLSTPYGDEADDREHMAMLANRLSNFDSDSGHDPSNTYDPAFYRVTLFDPQATPSPEAIEWPWPDIVPADFIPSDERPGSVQVMTREQVSKLTSVPNGGQQAIWVARPDTAGVANDEGPFEFSVRPLLPDEMPAVVEPMIPAST